MKKIVAAMSGMFLLIVWPGAAIWTSIFPHILGGGIAESFLYPIYGGMIILSGLVVGCTVVVLEEIKELKEIIKAKNEDSERE